MRNFQVSLQELQHEMPNWIRRYFRNVSVAKSDEFRLVLAIKAQDDVRIVAEKIGPNEVRLECRRYQELQPVLEPLDPQVQGLVERLERKLGEYWTPLKVDHLPLGESEYSVERTNVPRELQINSTTLRQLYSLRDEEKPPDYEETLQRYEAERIDLEQRLRHHQWELDEIFELIQPEVTSSMQLPEKREIRNSLTQREPTDGRQRSQQPKETNNSSIHNKAQRTPRPASRFRATLVKWKVDSQSMGLTQALNVIGLKHDNYMNIDRQNAFLDKDQMDLHLNDRTYEQAWDDEVNRQSAQ
jgi:hypothetical protein